MLKVKDKDKSSIKTEDTLKRENVEIDIKRERTFDEIGIKPDLKEYDNSNDYLIKSESLHSPNHMNDTNKTNKQMYHKENKNQNQNKNEYEFEYKDEAENENENENENYLDNMDDDDPDLQLARAINASQTRDLFTATEEESENRNTHCLLCSITLQDKTHNLSRHLERRHPSALLYILEKTLASKKLKLNEKQQVSPNSLLKNSDHIKNKSKKVLSHNDYNSSGNDNDNNYNENKRPTKKLKQKHGKESLPIFFIKWLKKSKFPIEYIYEMNIKKEELSNTSGKEFFLNFIDSFNVQFDYKQCLLDKIEKVGTIKTIVYNKNKFNICSYLPIVPRKENRKLIKVIYSSFSTLETYHYEPFIKETGQLKILGTTFVGKIIKLDKNHSISFNDPKQLETENCYFISNYGISCMNCSNCTNMDKNKDIKVKCINKKWIGNSDCPDGTLTEYLLLPNTTLYKIDENIISIKNSLYIPVLSKSIKIKNKINKKILKETKYRKINIFVRDNDPVVSILLYLLLKENYDNIKYDICLIVFMDTMIEKQIKTTYEEKFNNLSIEFIYSNTFNKLNINEWSKIHENKYKMSHCTIDFCVTSISMALSMYITEPLGMIICTKEANMNEFYINDINKNNNIIYKNEYFEINPPDFSRLVVNELQMCSIFEGNLSDAIEYLQNKPKDFHNEIFSYINNINVSFQDSLTYMNSFNKNNINLCIQMSSESH